MQLESGQRLTVVGFRGREFAYRVIRRLGDGYLADVYLVRDEALGDQVVAKVLKERFLNAPAKVADFLQEADILLQLAHRPEVVQLRGPAKGEVHLEGGLRLPCVVQEYVTAPYRNLVDLITEGLSESEGIEISRQFARLLHYAHIQDIVYLDLKPEHIFWNGRQIKVIDWNIARDLSHSDGGTREQSIAKDLVGLGQVMYYIFTGRPTVQHTVGPTPASLALGRVSGEHVDFETMDGRHDLPFGLRYIISKALLEVSEQGYPSAWAVEEALARHVQTTQQPAAERIAQARSEISKGLAALEAGDDADALERFERAMLYAPGLGSLSCLLGTHLRQDADLPPGAWAQIHEGLSQLRAALDEGEVNLVLPALRTAVDAAPTHPVLEAFHDLVTEMVEAVLDAKEALSARGDRLDKALLREVLALESHPAVLRARLSAARTETPPQPAVDRPTVASVPGVASPVPSSAAERAADLPPPSSTTPSPPQEPNRWSGQTDLLLVQAREAFEKGRFEAAIKYFEAVLQQDPHNLEAKRGVSLARRRQEELATHQIQGLISQGQAALNKGDIEEALLHYRRALARDPDNIELQDLIRRTEQAQTHLNAARAAEARGDFATAADAYARVMSLLPWPYAQQRHAECRERAQSQSRSRADDLIRQAASVLERAPEEAMNLLKQAQALAPDHPRLHELMFQARRRYDALLAKRRLEIQSLLEQGRAALETGQVAAAREYFSRVLALDPNNREAEAGKLTVRELEAHLGTGKTMLEAGHYDRAAAALAEALSIAPASQKIRALHRQAQVNDLLEQAKQHIASEAYNEALNALDGLLGLDPTHMEAQRLRQEVERKLADLAYRKEEAARQETMQKLKELTLRGQACMDAHDYDGAVRAFEAAQQLVPHHAGIATCLREAMQQRARLTRVRTLIEQALQARQAAKYDWAIETLEVAVQLAPDPSSQNEAQTLLEELKRIQRQRRLHHILGGAFGVSPGVQRD